MKTPDHSTPALPWVQLLAATSEAEWPINPKVRRVTKCSRETYLKHARQFVAYFEGSAEQLGAEHVRRWLRWQSSTKRLSPATAAREFGRLREPPRGNSAGCGSRCWLG
jgi:hypothetical protein